MKDLVVWTGPVARAQVPGATVPDAAELFLPCRGDQGPHPYCPTLGVELRGDVRALLLRAHMPESELGELFLSAYSAGGSVLKRLLENPGYVTRTTAVTLFDATYTTTWDDPKRRIPPPIEGFAAYGVHVAEGPGDQLFIATASPSPNQSWATGIENLAAVRRAIEQQTGKKFTLLEHFFGIEPAPAHVYKLGNVLFVEYSMQPLGHNHTTIAPAVYQQIVVPWLDKGKGLLGGPEGLPEKPPDSSGRSPPPKRSPWFEALVVVASFIGGYELAGWLRKKLV